MPLVYLRRLTGRERSQAANRELAHYLSFIAGAANAGGYLAVGQYTSHMSGIVSAMADNLAVGGLQLMLAGLGALTAFTAGAAATAVMVNWGQRRSLESVYALPLMVEAALLVCFGLLGGHLEQDHVLRVSATVILLCFTMGLQNAIITKISKAVIRTTHVTGMVTDIGIELGKLLYWNRHQRASTEVVADRDKLRLLSSLVGLFFVGGVAGAVGFKRLGFVSVLPLAVVLVVLAIVPLLDDVRERRRGDAGA